MVDPSMGPRASVELVERFLEAWNAKELDRAFEMVAKDAVWDDPAMQAPAHGRSEIRAFAEAVLTAFPDFEIRARGPVCASLDGSACALPWRIRGTHLKPLPPGYGPTLRTACFDGVDYIGLRGGKIVSIETLFDLRAAAGQLLGIPMRPRPGGFAERLLVCVQRFVAALVRGFGRRGPATPAGD
jgi:steroid delta-isomerase-like uncharacterized protein